MYAFFIIIIFYIGGFLCASLNILLFHKKYSKELAKEKHLDNTLTFSCQWDIKKNHQTNLVKTD